jgi:hypothetical protein
MKFCIANNNPIPLFVFKIFALALLSPDPQKYIQSMQRYNPLRLVSNYHRYRSDVDHSSQSFAYNQRNKKFEDALYNTNEQAMKQKGHEMLFTMIQHILSSSDSTASSTE